MRDNIVQPIEQNLAGTADLQTFNSVVQQGQASISAIFDINSDQATDLALTNKAIQAAEKYLPTNLTPPTVNLYDPSQSVVVTLAIYSQKLSLSRLALYAQNIIAPQLEQVPGISFANVGGLVTPAYEVVVDPVRLAAANLTLNDVIATLQADNQRVPGGFAYEPNRQTTIDVRGDIQSLDTVRNLAIIPAGNGALAGVANSTGAQVQSYLGGLSGLAGVVDPWTATNSVVRVGDVATVTEGYEPRLQFAHISGQSGTLYSGPKIRDGQRGDASNNVLRELPLIEKQLPRNQVHRHQRSIEVHRAADSSRHPNADARDPSDRHRDDFLPALVAQRDRGLRLHSNVAGNRDDGDEARAPYDRHDLAARHVAGHRNLSRRLDGRARKHRAALHRAQTAAGRGSGPRARRNRRGGGRDYARGRGRLSADRLHPRAGRSPNRRVRYRRGDLDVDLALRFLYDHADAGGALGAAFTLEAVARGGLVRRKVRRRESLVHESRPTVEPPSRRPRRDLLRGHVRAGAGDGRFRRGRRGVHSAGRSRRDLHAAGLSHRNADSNRSDRRLRARGQDHQDARRLRKHRGRRRVCGVVRRLRIAKQRRAGARLAQGWAQASDRAIG